MSGEESKGLAARTEAARLVQQTLRAGQAFDDLFQQSCDSGAMGAFEARDRAFTRLMAATVLRRKGQIDEALARYMKRALPAKAGYAVAVLQVAAAQLLFLDTPAHAAIDMAVRALDADKATARYKGLANAVLRRVSEASGNILAGQNAARLNTPDWLMKRWRASYGEDAARSIALAHLAEPPLDLTVKADPEDWAERLGGRVFEANTVRLPEAGQVTRFEGFASGDWWVQDAAAAVPARLFRPVEGAEVLDLCAAPGGKTMQLAAAGARVTAIDISARRMQRLEQNLARVGLTAHLVTSSILDYTPDRQFRMALLDAPCSSTGTVRRHPDVAHTKSEKTITDLAAIQSRLLDRTLDLIEPDGVLVYSTCSLEPEEGEHHAERMVREGLARRLPVDPGEVGVFAEAVTAEGDLRILPFHCQGDDPRFGGTDGFFVTRLQKL